jgi:hypothetical protein
MTAAQSYRQHPHRPPADTPRFREWLDAQHHPNHAWHGKPWATVEAEKRG